MWSLEYLDARTAVESKKKWKSRALNIVVSIIPLSSVYGLYRQSSLAANWNLSFGSDNSRIFETIPLKAYSNILVRSLDTIFTAKNYFPYRKFFIALRAQADFIGLNQVQSMTFIGSEAVSLRIYSTQLYSMLST